MSKSTDWVAVRKSLQKYMALLPKFRARFGAARSRRSKLRKESLSAVRRWDWYDSAHFELDPAYFLLAFDEKPGRLLKREPNFRIGAVRYGFDEAGRIRVRDAFAISEEFREHSAARVDAIRFHRDTGNCLSVQTLFLDGNRPRAHVIYDRNHMTVQLYEHAGGRIAKILEADRQHPVAGFGSQGAPRWSFTAGRLVHQKSGLIQILRDDEEGGETEIRHYKPPGIPKIKTPAPDLDLRKDVVEISKLLLGRAVKRFLAKRKKDMSVSGIGIVFQPFNNPEPEIYINFDTRPVFEPDGTWTHECFETCPRVNWKVFLDACEEHGGGTLIDAAGKRRKITDVMEDERIEKWFGEALVQSLKRACRNGIFKPLPKAVKCEMGVESIEGGFGWPRYEDRGKQNHV